MKKISLSEYEKHLIEVLNTSWNNPEAVKIVDGATTSYATLETLRNILRTLVGLGKLTQDKARAFLNTKVLPAAIKKEIISPNTVSLSSTKKPLSSKEL